MIETARGSVHEWQRDHMGHINVRAYMDKFEEACWQLYAAVGMTPSRLRDGDARLAAVQQNIGYQRELMPGDIVVIRSGVLELREKVLRFRHEMHNAETDELSATCEFTVVCLDTVTRKSRPFPPDVAQRARALMIAA